MPTAELPTAEAGDGRTLAAVLRGASVALLGSLVGGGLGFVFPVVMAHLLSQHGFGLLVLVLNLLLAVSALGTAGADYAAIRGVAAAVLPGAKRGAMRTPLLFVAALNVTAGAILAIAAPLLARHVFGEPSLVWPLRALALVLPLTVCAQMFSACLSGLERASGELVRKVVEQAGRVALAPAGLALGLGVAGAVLGMAVAAGAAAVAVGWLLLRALPRGGTTDPVPLRGVVGFSWPQTVANGAAQVWQLATIVVLAQATSARVVAVYGAALALARLPALVYNSFSFRFSPLIARLWSSGARDELSTLLQSVTRWVVMVALPFYAVAIALPGPLLRIYGNGYRHGALALALICVGSLSNSLAGPVEWTLIMAGRVKLEMAANVAVATCVFGISLWLIPQYGLTGAAIATLMQSVALNTVKTVFVARTLALRTFSPALLRPIVSAAVAGAAGALVDAATHVGSSLPGLAALGLLVLAVYAVALFLLGGMSADDRRALSLAIRPAR